MQQCAVTTPPHAICKTMHNSWPTKVYFHDEEQLKQTFLLLPDLLEQKSLRFSAIVTGAS